jgi:hypothetical protein
LSVAESNAGTNSVTVIAQPAAASTGIIPIHDSSATADYQAATGPVAANSGTSTRTPVKPASAQLLDRVFADVGEDLFEEVAVMPRTGIASEESTGR